MALRELRFTFLIMKEIELTLGFTTQVDDYNYSWLNQWNWQTLRTLTGNYAIRKEIINNKRYTIYMHKIILKIPLDSKVQGDHKDGNKLNNQEYNLRRATSSQNNINRKYNNKYGYRGVTYKEATNKFIAAIKVNGRRKHLGMFDTAIDAAKEYDIAALKYQGEFANLNFK